MVCSDPVDLPLKQSAREYSVGPQSAGQVTASSTTEAVKPAPKTEVTTPPKKVAAPQPEIKVPPKKVVISAPAPEVEAPPKKVVAPEAPKKPVSEAKTSILDQPLADDQVINDNVIIA